MTVRSLSDIKRLRAQAAVLKAFLLREAARSQPLRTFMRPPAKNSRALDFFAGAEAAFGALEFAQPLFPVQFRSDLFSLKDPIERVREMHEELCAQLREGGAG